MYWMKHYRKAKKDEVKCAQCCFYYGPRPYQKLGRCGDQFRGYAPVVGLKMTCDAAHNKREGNEKKRKNA